MLLWAVLVREFTGKRPIFFWVSLGTLLLVAIACSFPAVRIVDWLVWLPTIGMVAALPFAPKSQSRQTTAVRPQASDVNDALDQVLQQVTRLRTAEGKDAVRATLTAEFAAGERQSTVYVGFCPPFELLPDVEADVADDSEEHRRQRHDQAAAMGGRARRKIRSLRPWRAEQRVGARRHDQGRPPRFAERRPRHQRQAGPRRLSRARREPGARARHADECTDGRTARPRLRAFRPRTSNSPRSTSAIRRSISFPAKRARASTSVSTITTARRR